MASEEADGYSSISGLTLEKAMNELKEDPLTRASAVQEFRKMILQKEEEFKTHHSSAESEPLTFQRKDNRFLLRFLRARKFNTDRAVQLYVNYYKYQRKFHHLLTEFHPHSVKNVISAGVFGVLDQPMYNGSKVICVIPARWDYKNVPQEEPYKTFMMMLEKLVDDEEIQVHGLSIFDNMADMSWHLGYAFMSTEALQKGALVELQDSFPVRFKGFHMLNQPWYLSMIMTIVKPFLSQKHRDRIQAHGDNMAALHDFIDPMHLPMNFGGDAAELEAENLKKFFEEDFLCAESMCSQTISIHSGRE